MEYCECSRRLADCNKLLCALSDPVSKTLDHHADVAATGTCRQDNRIYGWMFVSSYLEHILRLRMRWRRHAGQPPLLSDSLDGSEAYQNV